MTDTQAEKAREARNAYRREWYRKNKDKAKAIQQRYWLKKARQADAADAETADPE